MNIRKCNNCGWEFPDTYIARSCKFCGTMLTMGYCNACGEWSDNLYKNYCRACQTKQHQAWRSARRATRDEQLENWKLAISEIPKPYSALTESQWLEACKHFGGCAFCGADEIESRAMFVPFRDGGRYCSWNIVPACEKCETAIVRIKNPFKRMDDGLQRCKGNQARVRGFTLQRLEAIQEYLQREIDNAKK